VIEAFGTLETTGYTPALVALDAMDKRAGVRLLQVELNDMLGVVVKVVGSTDAVAEAIAAGKSAAEAMQGKPIVNVINRPDPRAWAALESKAEFSPLIQRYVVMTPSRQAAAEPHTSKESTVAETQSFALGLIETQGFTAVFEAIDSACKSANVEVVAKEKLGGGYITVVIKGDVAAVKAAVDTGKSRVEGLGKLIAAHVIARPSAAVLSLLPKP
jgi:carbon dioxide concentrating mechanism protein CcmO